MTVGSVRLVPPHHPTPTRTSDTVTLLPQDPALVPPGPLSFPLSSGPLRTPFPPPPPSGEDRSSEGLRPDPVPSRRLPLV